jgi:hypothetical protein
MIPIGDDFRLYRGRVPWLELSRCSPAGRRLIRAWGIRSFPALLVQSGDRGPQRTEGVEPISELLRNLAAGAAPGK